MKKQKAEEEECSKWLSWQIEGYGFLTDQPLMKAQAWGILRCLKQRLSFAQIAKNFHVHSWEQLGPTAGQVKMMDWKVPDWKSRRPQCKRDASLLIDAVMDPEKYQRERFKDIDKARSDADLDAVGLDIGLCKGLLPFEAEAALIEAGKQKRQEVKGTSGPIPE